METTNYDQFDFLPGNREVNKSNIDKIINSIRNHGYVGTPILVNKDFLILDGQHRFEALKQLGMPIPYEFRDFDLKAIQDINSASKKWSILDHVKSLASLGHDEYCKILKYIDLSGLPYTYVITVLNKSYVVPPKDRPDRAGQFSTADILSGNWVCYNCSFFDFYMAIIPKLKLISDVWDTGRVLLALAWVTRHIEVDPPELIDRMVAHRHLFTKGFPSSGLWVLAMQDTWNYGRLDRNRVDFFKRSIDRCEAENAMIQSKHQQST